MGRNKVLIIAFVAVVVLLVGAIVFFSLQTTPSEQSNDAGEISNGVGAGVDMPPQVSKGEELAVTESSSINNEREVEITFEDIAVTETGDFALTVSVEETTLPQGQRFRVHVELENISEEDKELTYDFLFMPQIEGWDPLRSSRRETPPLESVLLEANGVIRHIAFHPMLCGLDGWRIGGDLELGVHELRVSAKFWLGGDEQQIEILSDPILLTVIEATTTAEDFAVTVIVEETTLPQGEDFRVIVELKNNSGEDQEIEYEFLFFPRIPGWRPWGGIAIDPPYPIRIIFEANGILRNTEIRTSIWGADERGWRIGADLEPGTHKLRVSVMFWPRDHDRFIQFLSEPVTLTVE